MPKPANDRETAAWAETLRALANPVRLRIVFDLLKGRKCVNDIRELADAPQPNISQHLAVLRHGGLVDYERQGTSRCYFLISTPMIRKLLDLLKRQHPIARAKRKTGWKRTGKK